jgi:hypothetical protein
MSYQSRLFAVLGATLVVAACRETMTDAPAAPVAPTPRGTYALTLSSSALSIVQGSIAAVSVDIARTNFTGSVTLAVAVSTFGGTMPDGVSTAWTPKVVSGSRSVLTFTVDSAAVPGVYEFIVFGVERQGPGVPGFAPFTLTVLPDLRGPVIRQWATTATASSQWGDESGAARQATGAPDVGVNVCGEDDVHHAWSSRTAGNGEWLELSYTTPVQATMIRVYENWSPGSIVKVEVKDAGGQYTTVYTAPVTNPGCPHTLEIPVTGVMAKISAVRISVDQLAHQDWNEIDAVQLVGFSAPPSAASTLRR